MSLHAHVVAVRPPCNSVQQTETVFPHQHNLRSPKARVTLMSVRSGMCEIVSPDKVFQTALSGVIFQKIQIKELKWNAVSDATTMPTGTSMVAVV
jgi:hypothetical protein